MIDTPIVKSIKEKDTSTLLEIFSVLSKDVDNAVTGDILQYIETELKLRKVKITDPLKQFNK